MPPPFSFGAPRPLTRSSFPFSEPGGTLSETGPSGVGTSTVAPSAASAYVTGHVEHEVGAAALEERRRLDLGDDEEVARGAAVAARPRPCP